MHIRSLLAILVSCSAAFGCETTPTESASAQPKSEPAVITGSRLPGNSTGMTGQVGRDDWANDKRQGGTGVIFK